MRAIIRFLTVADIFILLGMIRIRMWWMKNHAEPGLAEMLNIHDVDVMIIISAAAAMIFIAVLIALKARKR